MPLTITQSNDIQESVYNQLWLDTYDKTSAEQEVLGPNTLKSSLFRDHTTNTSIVYKIDDKIIGYGNYTEYVYNGEPYIFYGSITLGKDINGSRSYFYTEDFWKAFHGLVKDLSCKGIIYIVNPKSGLFKAITTAGPAVYDGTQYFKIGTYTHEIKSEFPQLGQLLNRNNPLSAIILDTV